MAEEEPRKPKRASRDDLYRQVWETPMSRPAAQYGIAGNDPAKICKRLQILVPGRGYWARKASDQKIVQNQLPELDRDTPLEVTIAPTPPPAKSPGMPTAVGAAIPRGRLQPVSSARRVPARSDYGVCLGE